MTPASDTHITAALERFQRDPAALGRVDHRTIDRYIRGIIRYRLHLTHELDDLTGDVWLRLAGRLDALAEARDVMSYLISIVSHLVIDHQRRAHAAKRTPERIPPVNTLLDYSESAINARLDIDTCRDELDDRDQAIVGAMLNGATPTEHAGELGYHPNGVYKARRRIVRNLWAIHARTEVPAQDTTT